jgi:hypothetical protein
MPGRVKSLAPIDSSTAIHAMQSFFSWSRKSRAESDFVDKFENLDFVHKFQNSDFSHKDEPMTPNQKRVEVAELKRLTDEIANVATKTIASGQEPINRMSRALMMAAISIYSAQHGERATAAWCRELASAIDRS